MNENQLIMVDEYIFGQFELFQNTTIETSRADIVKDGICVLDIIMIYHIKVNAAGHWITFPSIAKNVGKIRIIID